MRRGPHHPGLWREEVCLGLGSNMGDRFEHLRLGIRALQDHGRVVVLSVSSIYESEFVGEGVQDPYLNACLCLRTTLTPNELLGLLKVIEEGRGRRPGSHMQPRPLDLDILFFGDRHFTSKGLIVPHPRMMERSFVLEPLAELVPGKKNPDSRETVAKVCANIPRQTDNRLMVRSDLYLIAATPDH